MHLRQVVKIGSQWNWFYKRSIAGISVSGFEASGSATTMLPIAVGTVRCFMTSDFKQTTVIG
jgi:hypothetical protein